MTRRIKKDHVQIVERLQLAEKQWAKQKKQLEAERIHKLADIKARIEERIEAIRPERSGWRTSGKLVLPRRISSSTS